MKLIILFYASNLFAGILAEDYWKYLNLENDFMILWIKILLIMSGIIIVATLLHKIQVEKKQRRFIHKVNLFKIDIGRILRTGNYEKFKHPQSNLEYFAIASVAITYIKKNKDVYFIHHLLDNEGVFDHLKHISSKRFSFSRLEAIEQLGLLKYRKNKKFLFSIMIFEKNRRAREHAAIGVSYLLQKQDLPYFLQEFIKMKVSGKYIEFVFANIINGLIERKEESGIYDIFYFFYKTKNTSIFLKSFVEAIGFLKINYSSEELQDLYFMAQSIELKVAIIRAIGVLDKGVKADEALALALNSEKDILRISASKSLNIFDFDKYKELIMKLLGDSNYNVRLNTALSLGEMQKGRKLLQNIFETSSDIYAQEMAKYALIVNERNEKSLPILTNWKAIEELEKIEALEEPVQK